MLGVEAPGTIMSRGTAVLCPVVNVSDINLNGMHAQNKKMRREGRLHTEPPPPPPPPP